MRIVFEDVEILGHFVTSEGDKTDPSKVSKVMSARFHQYKQERSSFLMFGSFYRMFLQGFVQVTAPFHALSVDRVRLESSEESNNAFKIVKERLSRPPIFTDLDVTKPLVVFVYSTVVAVGSSLMQNQNSGRYHRLQYATLSLSTEECRYSKF